jgi:hypothetical protein
VRQGSASVGIKHLRVEGINPRNLHIDNDCELLPLSLLHYNVLMSVEG